MTRMPSALGNGLSRAASSMSGSVTATAPPSRPAAPTPALAIKNLRRLSSGIIVLRRQVFGGVDRSRYQSARIADEVLEARHASIAPCADPDEVPGRIDAITRCRIFDDREVAQGGELVSRPGPCRRARSRQPGLAARPAVDVGGIERTLTH